MLLAVAGPARGRSHTSRTGSDPNDIYGFFDRSHYQTYDNGTGSAFRSVFDECDSGQYGEDDLPIIHYVPLVLYPFLLLQGIVGNFLAIPVLVSISRTAWSTVLYLACLGGTDLLLLLIRCGDAWYQEAMKLSLSKRIIDSSDAACKTYYFAFMCTKHFNPWLLVAVSIEMMIASRWPKRTYRMCSLERARNVIMLIGIIIVCLDINHFWTFRVPKPGIPCIYFEEFSENFNYWLWPALDTAVELVLPVILVTICFFLTAASLIRRPATRSRDLDVEMKNYFLELTTLKDFSMISFILCLLFICLNTCRVAYTLTSLLSTIGYFDVECPVLRGIKTIDASLNYLFYSSKIYLFLAFSAMFRAKLRERFLSVRRKIQRCYRMVFLCGHKWVPVPPKDKRDDARVPPGQVDHHSPDRLHGNESNTHVHDPSEYRKTADGANDSRATARSRHDSYTSVPCNQSHADAQDIGIGPKSSQLTEVSDFTKEDSFKRKHKTDTSVNATKV